SFLKKIPNFNTLIRGKIYLGSSGGAYAVCRYFFENEKPGVYEGLGILPCKIICHYKSSYKNATSKDWDLRVKKLAKKGEELEIIKLKETEDVEFQNHSKLSL